MQLSRGQLVRNVLGSALVGSQGDTSHSGRSPYHREVSPHGSESQVLGRWTQIQIAGPSGGLHLGESSAFGVRDEMSSQELRQDLGHSLGSGTSSRASPVSPQHPRGKEDVGKGVRRVLGSVSRE